MNCDSNFVSMNSKTEYYDSDKILSKWGFTDSQCHNCGISNSDINGLLMQCGKCRRAYYCSMKCFNDHLPEHNKYCGTKSIQCQPKGKGIDMDFNKNPVKQPILDEEKPKKVKKAKKKSVKKQPDPVVVEEVVPPPVVEEEEELELDDLMEDLKVTEPKPEPANTAMSQSFSHFGRAKQRTIAEREPFVKEQVNLRHTEFSKHEYPWMTPEWINAQLRKTERGRKLLEEGDSSGPVTDLKSLIEQGYISWEKPEWTQPKLRKTARGEAIKREAIAHENSFKEERAHNSFSF